jgi:DNA-binding transcriptional ArsR family regulator
MHDMLSPIFHALADPTRRAILARLKRGEASVSELAQPFLGAMSLPGVTKHLRVLENAGLVTKGREAQWRPCTLNPAPLKDASEWMDEYRVMAEASLDRLGEYLKTVTGKSLDENAVKKDLAKSPSTTVAKGAVTKSPKKTASKPVASNASKAKPSKTVIKKSLKSKLP